jgi:type II secretory pathway component PulF
MIPDATNKHLFYMELAKLLDAGFDIRKAAGVLRDTRLPAAQAALLKDLDRGLESGQSITGAFGSDTGSITELERGIIGAGERGGKLGPAFQHLADYFGMLATARREIISGMIYPVAVLHMGFFIGTVPMALMKGGKTAWGIFGSFLITLLVAYTVAFLVFLAIRAVLAMAPENAGIDRTINRIPWIGHARRSMAMARFCKVYHSCLLAGVNMSETVSMASHASASGIIRDAGATVAEAAKHGERIGPRLISSGAFPNAFARSYATGEEAGTLDIDLARWARLFQEEAASGVRKASMMIPRVLYFIILAFVAWKIVSFFNGYYGGMLEMMED